MPEKRVLKGRRPIGGKLGSKSLYIYMYEVELTFCFLQITLTNCSEKANN